MKKKISIILSLALLLLVFAGCQNAASAAGQVKPNTPQGGSADQTTSVPPASTGTITREQAEKIALDHAGFTAHQVTGLHTEYDRDDRISHYDVDFYQGGYEYDYEINAQTGEILKSEKEWD